MIPRRAQSPSFRSVLEWALFLVTFGVILFFSVLIGRTTQLICENDGARQFLERIRAVPLEGWKVTAYSCALFALLVASSTLRPRLGPGSVRHALAGLADLCVCAAIVAVLDFGYRGVFFIAIVNSMRWIERARTRYALVLLSVAAYIVTDFDIVSLRFPAFSIGDYMDYYGESRRVFWYGARTLLVSLNEIVFILFMVMEVNSWMAENSKIRELNGKLLRTARDLRLANASLEEYARRSEQSARARERNRLAREIHDILGHSLTGIEVGLKACLEIFRRDPERVRDQLGKIADMARSGLEDVRRSVHELKPDAAVGLADSLARLAEGVRAATGRDVALEVAGDRRTLPPLVEECLYRAAQEGVTNAVRHGDAARVELELRFGPESVELAVRDDGKGAAALSEGFGLGSMRARAEALGGQVFFPARERGFAAMISIPLPGDAP